MKRCGIRVTILCAVFSIFLLPHAYAQAPDFVRLPEEANGQKALSLLGKNLPLVAREHGMSAERLRELFETDKSLHVDTGGRLLYIEQEQLEQTEEVDSAILAESDSVIAPESAFLLNSKLGAKKTLYLDFRGRTLTGTAWNTKYGKDPLVFPPFDLDGNTIDFSTTERNAIISVYRRVAEDFSPFDINVTTQAPSPDAITRSSSTDDVYGTIALITNSNGLCTCGGTAYIGAFSNTGDNLKPALVFYDRLAKNENYIAQAVSHEVGHNLGLTHDGLTDGTAYYQGHGSGTTAWAPIMGVGYFKPVTQWSKGEYSGANNLQDDIQEMQNRGLLPRVDDYGNSVSSATSLSQGASFGISGIIETRADVDYFRFSAGAGEVSLEALSASLGPNLDIKIAVYNTSGQKIAEASPENALPASLVFSSPSEASYVVSVEGVGNLTASTGYTDYGSLGKYTLLGTATTPTGNISPTAIAKASTLSGQAPLVVNFSGTDSGDPDGTIASYTWDFGNGAQAQGATAQYSFGQGTHQVTLTVSDNGGLVDSDALTLTVSASNSNTLVAPSLTSTSVTSSSVQLSWTDSSSVEAGFRVFRRAITISGKGKTRSTTYGSWVNVSTLAPNAVNYLDTGLNSSSNYEYYVEGFVDSGTTAKSNTIQVKTSR